MSRRRAAQKRMILPDAKHNNVMLTKFINNLMTRGKRSTAEHIVYGALDLIAERLKKESIGVFLEALENVSPSVEVRSRRVGGATYQVPMEVRETRRRALAIRWMITAARKRSERTMRERLAGEIMDAINNRGSAVKKREDTHKMAEANKAFSHYRW